MRNTNRLSSGQKEHTTKSPVISRRLDNTPRLEREGKKDLLLRRHDFVAKSKRASFETTPLACEASALTTELTAQNHTHFSPQERLCKDAYLASPNLSTEIAFSE